jgi:hypothetical protein
MATSLFNPISVRNPVIDAFPGSTGPLTAIFHGAIACVNSSGFVEDYTTTSCPRVLGVVDNYAGKAGSTGDVIGTQGSINNANNLVNLVTDGDIDSIPFNSDLTAKDVGKSVYAIDNFTVTCNPSATTCMQRIGTLKKFYTTTKGEFRLEGYGINGFMERAGAVTTQSSSIMMAFINPLGVDIVLNQFLACVTTAASSGNSAGFKAAVGIGATSTTIAADVCSSSIINWGTTGCYGTGTVAGCFGNVYWGATKYITFSSCSAIGDGGSVGTLVAYWKINYKALV